MIKILFSVKCYFWGKNCNITLKKITLFSSVGNLMVKNYYIYLFLLKKWLARVDFAKFGSSQNFNFVSITPYIALRSKSNLLTNWNLHFTAKICRYLGKTKIIFICSILVYFLQALILFSSVGTLKLSLTLNLSLKITSCMNRGWEKNIYLYSLTLKRSILQEGGPGNPRLVLTDWIKIIIDTVVVPIKS